VAHQRAAVFAERQLEAGFAARFAAVGAGEFGFAARRRGGAARARRPGLFLVHERAAVVLRRTRFTCFLCERRRRFLLGQAVEDHALVRFPRDRALRALRFAAVGAPLFVFRRRRLGAVFAGRRQQRVASPFQF